MACSGLPTPSRPDTMVTPNVSVRRGCRVRPMGHVSADQLVIAVNVVAPAFQAVDDVPCAFDRFAQGQRVAFEVAREQHAVVRIADFLRQCAKAFAPVGACVAGVKAGALQKCLRLGAAAQIGQEGGDRVPIRPARFRYRRRRWSFGGLLTGCVGGLGALGHLAAQFAHQFQFGLEIDVVGQLDVFEGTRWPECCRHGTGRIRRPVPGRR